MDFSNVKVGDKVKSVLRGWGKVSVARLGTFCVNFGEPYNWDWFWNDGRKRKTDENPEIIDLRKKEWEPKCGEYFVDGTEGRTFNTREQAKIAKVIFRKFQRQLVWIFENYPEYDPFSKSYYYNVCYNNDLNEWDVVYVPTMHGMELKMPEHIAKKLAKKLNSGEVKL